MAYSRISRTEEKRTRKILLLTSIGIIAVIALLITIGIPAIIGLSVLISNFTNRQTQIDNADKTAPYSPVLSPIATATNSAVLKLSGYGEPDSNLTIYINQEEKKKILLGADGNFSISENWLEDGDNDIYATLTDRSGNVSLPSESIRVLYNKKAPKLEVTEPAENQEFQKDQKEITIKGTTDASTLHINERFAGIKNDGSFSFTYKLNAGENIIQFVAKDLAGNETKLERKVNYSP